MQDGEGFFFENYAEGDVFWKNRKTDRYANPETGVVTVFSLFRSANVVLILCKCCVNPVLENGVFPIPITAFLFLVRIRSRLIGCLRR